MSINLLNSVKHTVANIMKGYILVSMIVLAAPTRNICQLIWQEENLEIKYIQGVAQYVLDGMYRIHDRQDLQED